MQSWQPEVLAPSHENPTYGADANRERLRRYRDAILFVHDETVQGMNAGLDVFTLMDAIELPPELDVGEGYGAVAWTVRGIRLTDVVLAGDPANAAALGMRLAAVEALLAASGNLNADFGHRERPDRSIVNTWIGSS